MPRSPLFTPIDLLPGFLLFCWFIFVWQIGSCPYMRIYIYPQICLHLFMNANTYIYVQLFFIDSYTYMLMAPKYSPSHVFRWFCPTNLPCLWFLNVCAYKCSISFDCAYCSIDPPRYILISLISMHIAHGYTSTCHVYLLPCFLLTYPL